MAYPALRTTKEDNNDNFQLSPASTLPQQANSDFVLKLRSAIGADELFHTATQTNTNREKNMMKFFFRSTEDFSDRLKTFPTAFNCQKF